MSTADGRQNHDHDRDKVIERTRLHARLLARELDTVAHTGCVPSTATVRDLVKAVVNDLGTAPAGDHTARLLDGWRLLGSQLDIGPASAAALIQARNLAEATEHALTALKRIYVVSQTRMVGHGLDRHVVSACGQHRTTRVAPSAAHLLVIVGFLLPAGDRARYAEEYLSELWELAESGAGRRRQLRYAFRQLCSALSMSFALRSPRRRGAAP